MIVDSIREFSLYPKGKILIGYEKPTGQRVGTSALVCKLEIPPDCGLYPDGWFPVRNKSMHSLVKEIESAGGSIPQTILLDCYSYHWTDLYHKSRG